MTIYKRYTKKIIKKKRKKEGKDYLKSKKKKVFFFNEAEIKNEDELYLYQKIISWLLRYIKNIEKNSNSLSLLTNLLAKAELFFPIAQNKKKRLCKYNPTLKIINPMLRPFFFFTFPLFSLSLLHQSELGVFARQSKPPF